MNNVCRQLSAFAMSAWLALTAVVFPLKDAEAAASRACPSSVPSAVHEGQPICHTVTAAVGTQVTYPALNWKKVIEVDVGRTANSQDIELRMGDRAIVLNNRAAAMLGLEGKDIADVVQTLAGAAPIVFARYSPTTAELRIDISRVEKMPNGKIGVYVAEFTPYHGDMWKAQRAYLADSEKASNTRAGYNPFDRFKGGDSHFHNIGIDGLQVAVGHAMRHSNSPWGYVASADTRFHSWKKKSGGLLKKKITYHVDGYAKAHWYAVGSPELLPYGNSAAICASAADPCPPEQIVLSGVMMQDSQGGNMPSNEDLLYRWKKSVTGWTILAGMLFAGIMAFASAAIFGPGFLGTGIEINPFVEMMTQVLGGPLTPLQTGLVTAGGYGITSLTIGGASSLTDIQGSLFGGGIPGVLPFGSPQGMREPDVLSDKHQIGLSNAVRARQMANPEGGLSSFSSLYDRAGSHTDNYTEHNSVKTMQRDGPPIRDTNVTDFQFGN